MSRSHHLETQGGISCLPDDSMPFRLSAGEVEMIRAASDLTPEGRFGCQWVIVTSQRVLVAPSTAGSGIKEVSLDDVIRARIETFVGGGCLNVEVKYAAPLRVVYSAAHSNSF